jgi:hypothetical protein|tara:strand:+ start:257 stop:454 length:198 start_codon:yes stop_codon:yes gene_type:complete
MKNKLNPELKVQMELDAHEKLCEERYTNINEKLNLLDKRMWRLEAMSMLGTFSVVGLVVSIVVQN